MNLPHPSNNGSLRV